MKHQRLKILNKKCAFPDLEPSKWLTAPGFHNSANRILAAEQSLNDKYNPGKHHLVWNRKLGKVENKPDYGLIWCSSCGRVWPWASRMTQLNKTVCCMPSCTLSAYSTRLGNRARSFQSLYIASANLSNKHPDCQKTHHWQTKVPTNHSRE